MASAEKAIEAEKEKESKKEGERAGEREGGRGGGGRESPFRGRGEGIKPER